MKIVSAKKVSNVPESRGVEGCTEDIEEVRLVEITSAKNENEHKCSSCTLCIALFSIIFTINIGIGSYFLYFQLVLKKTCYSCQVWYPHSNNNLMNL